MSTASRTVTGKYQFTVSTCARTYPIVDERSRVIRPAIGRTAPAIARSNVVLPLPRPDDPQEIALGDGHVDVHQDGLEAVAAGDLLEADSSVTTGTRP